MKKSKAQHVIEQKLTKLTQESDAYTEQIADLEQRRKVTNAQIAAFEEALKTINGDEPEDGTQLA